MNNTISFEAEECFGVPKRLVDKHLNAPPTELRLILFLLRNTNRSFLKSDFTDLLKIDENNLEKAFDYWVKEGMLFKNGDKYSLERPRVAATDMMRYSADSIATRINESEKIRFLYNQTEAALSKQLTTEDASIVLSLVDWIGLLPEVAALLIQFCGKEGKSMKTILSTGIAWAEKNIDSYEKAESYLSELQARKETSTAVARLLGITNRAITETEKKLFYKWKSDYNYTNEIIALAYEITVKNTGNYAYAYMDKIITSWFENAFKTIEDINNSNNGEKALNAKKTKKRTSKNAENSVDTEASIDTSWMILSDGADDSE